MAFLGLRKWPTPVLRPLAPFIAGGAITFYLISTIQSAAIKSPEYANDPRNPYAEKIKQEAGHH